MWAVFVFHFFLMVNCSYEFNVLLDYKITEV